MYRGRPPWPLLQRRSTSPPLWGPTFDRMYCHCVRSSLLWLNRWSCFQKGNRWRYCLLTSRSPYHEDGENARSSCLRSQLWDNLETLKPEKDKRTALVRVTDVTKCSNRPTSSFVAGELSQFLRVWYGAWFWVSKFQKKSAMLEEGVGIPSTF